MAGSGEEHGGRFRCPMCDHMVSAEQNACPNCGQQFRYKTDKQKRREEQKKEDSGPKMCPVCKAYVFPGASGCSFCGTKFKDLEGREVSEEQPVVPETVEIVEEKDQLHICPKCSAFVEPGSESCSHCETSLKEGAIDLREISLDSEIAVQLKPEARHTFERYWAAMEMEAAKRRAERELKTAPKKFKPVKTKKLVKARTRRRYRLLPPLPKEGRLVADALVIISLFTAVAWGFAFLALDTAVEIKFGVLAAVFAAELLCYIGVIGIALKQDPGRSRHRLVEVMGTAAFFIPIFTRALPDTDIDLSVLMSCVAGTAIFIIFFSLVRERVYRDIWTVFLGMGFGAALHSVQGAGIVNNALMTISLLGCLASGVVLIISYYKDISPSKKDWEDLARSRRTSLDQPTYRGVYLLKLGDYNGAVKAIADEMNRFPDDEVLWNNKGNALAHLGRYQEALDSYDRAIAINPDYEVAWNNKGNTLARQMRYDEALWCYDKALAINPEYKQVLVNKQEVYTRMGRGVRI